MSETVVTLDDPIYLQGYRCPECGYVRDGRDSWHHGHADDDMGRVRQRWCHNYSLHSSGTRRKMRPVALFMARGLS